MKCPRCKVDLRKVQVAGVEIDLCGDCDGVWFDHDELERIFNVYGSELGGTELAPSLEGEGVVGEREGDNQLACPRCAAVLTRRKYDREMSVLVDGCEKGCGLWLDAGELSQIAAHIAKQRNLDGAEQESDLLLKIVKVEAEGDKRHEKMIDELVKADNESTGVTRRLGMAVQALYKALYKIGV